MTKKRKDPSESPHQNVILTVAPDTVTSEYLKPHVGSDRWRIVSVASDEEGFTSRLNDWIEKGIRLLVIAASPEMGTAQFEIAARSIEHKIPVIAWGFDRLSHSEDPDVRDRLLLNTLLVQQGAALITDPGCIRGALDLLHEIPSFNRSWRIVTDCLPQAIEERLVLELSNGGLSPLAKSRSKTAFVEVALDGGTWLIGQKGKTISLPGTPRQIAALISLASQLSSVKPAQAQQSDLQPQETPPEVDIFLRPPTRILSQTASKRLAAHFGISFPMEDLCQSATEALRFAAGLGGHPVVVKLVRPGLERKAEQNLVIKDVSGPAEIKTAIRTLSRRASELGPPDPLGFLVTPQILNGVRLWATLSRDSRLGTVLLFGNGDIPGVDALGAVDTTATIEECARVVSYCGTSLPPKAQSAVAGFLARLCNMIRQLAPHATRVEAHPIVYLEDEDEAHALDMLVEITA